MGVGCKFRNSCNRNGIGSVRYRSRKGDVMKTKTRIVAILLSLMFVVSCAHNVKTMAEMNPMEKATWMLSVYNAQYEDYKFQAARVDLDEERKAVLRIKKQILTEVYPLISVYAGYASSGIIPAIDLETAIITNLERLLYMI